ncbi:hypothetical protein ScPMuIL_000207 [Solemya velum]
MKLTEEQVESAGQSKETDERPQDLSMPGRHIECPRKRILTTQPTTEEASHIVCEHNSQVLSCPNDETVNIIHADFGRTEGEHICGGPVRTTDCSTGGSALTTMQSTCWNQHACTITASNNVFGDPCWGTFKYINVSYSCVATPGPSVRISCEISSTNGYGDPCPGTKKYLNVTYCCIDFETAFGRGWSALDSDVSQNAYLFLGKPKTNAKAQQRCQARGGNLVKIESAAENEMILSELMDTHKG